MKIEANTPEQCIAQVPEEQKQAMIRLRQTIHDNLPKGFKEEMSYEMIGYVVPKSVYPQGYHCAPELPLPFINIASQKNFVALYHMGIYVEKEILDWFTQEFPKYSKLKLDIGKSCIRLKKPELIPFDLIGELVKKITVEKWIEIYESNIKPKK